MSGQPANNFDPLEALVDGYLDGTLTEAEHAELFAGLETDPALLKRFADLTDLDAICREHAGNQIEAEQVRSQMLPLAEDPFGPAAATNLLNELATFEEGLEDELPLVDITEQVKQRRVNEPGVHLDRRRDEPRVTRTIELVIPTWAVYAGLAAACVIAALLLWPDPPESVPPQVADTPTPASPSIRPEPDLASPPSVPNEFVATLTAVQDAEWAEGDYVAGAKLRAGDRLSLTSGFAELTTARGAVSVLEAPVVIELLGDDNGLRLHAGKLVGRVNTPRAKGFTVYTPNGRIVDLGTEFGVSLDNRSGTQVHVFEGEVLAAPVDLAGDSAQSTIVRATQAVELNNKAGAVVSIDFDPQRFERRFVKRLDVVDIVAGGDGTTRRRDIGLNPVTASYSWHLGGEYRAVSSLSDGASRPVADSQFLAGVFIPDEDGIIETGVRGVVIPKLPATTGRSYGLIWCGGVSTSTADNHHTAIPVELGGIDYAKPGHQAVTMHANAGVVIDLEAVRRAYPNHRITSLRTRIGSTAQSAVSRAQDDTTSEFIIAMDERVLEHMTFRRSMKQDQRYRDLSIPITSSDRLLTLVSCDGGDNLSQDWLVLGDPQLVLEPKSTQPASNQ